MKKVLLYLILLSSCKINWYGDIDLGSGFYYMVDPDFNSIVIPVNQKKAFKSSIYIVKNVELIGFNENVILAISREKHCKEYWKIDKTMKTIKQGYDDSSLMK